EEEFRRRLHRARRIDGESGTTSVGPHRADITVYHEAHGLEAALSSTGEQKALLIAILLAEARLQMRLHRTRPVMLLDEVTAHLDGERREALFAAIGQMGVQAWFTGTDAVLFEGLAGTGQFLRVDGGRIAAF
ncbi:MAG TPA: DNA replication and repair protein RecF, partial [Stellaceae bacterium]|nr:DNA replication and repair protein RecF [Stellaceae bacterium]